MLLLAALAFMPRTASADTDPRWLPWLGCWQSATERAVSPDARVCFVPTATGEVERIAIIPVDPAAPIPDGQPLVADHLEHPIVDAQCAGTLRVDWSADGQRYFITSNRSCIDEVAAKTSSISLLLPGPAWVEAQVVDTFGRETVGVHRYRRVAVPESLSGRLPASLVAHADAAANSLATSRLTVAHVIDSYPRVNSHALEAVVLESNTPFLLTVQGLKALSKAGVDENVIDLMVAVSYPDHFNVNQPRSTDGGGGLAMGSMWYETPAICLDPFFFDPGFCYSSAAYLSYAYAAFERPYYVPPSVIVAPKPPLQPVPGPSAGVARAINNRGYTRVVESPGTPKAGATDSTRSSSGQQSSAGAGSSDSGASASSGSSSSGTASTSGSSGASSSGGYSSGGGGGTGRTAVPR